MSFNVENSKGDAALRGVLDRHDFLRKRITETDLVERPSTHDF